MTEPLRYEMFAHHYEDSERAPFQHFFPSAFTVALCGLKKPIVAVLVEQRPWAADTPPPDGYWGWWEYSDSRFHFVWPSKMQVEMCFPYGPAIEEKKGRGRLLPVTVTMLRLATEGEIDLKRRG